MAARKLVDKPFVASADFAPTGSESIWSVFPQVWISFVAFAAAHVPVRSAVLVSRLAVVPAELPFWEPAPESIKAENGPIAGVIDRGGTDD